jgi:DNA polymerase III delta prime subunit
MWVHYASMVFSLAVKSFTRVENCQWLLWYYCSANEDQTLQLLWFISQTQILFVDLCGVDIQVPPFKIIILDEADSLTKMLRCNTDHTLLLMCSFGCWI